MSRVRAPKCRHKNQTQVVSSGSYVPGEANASATVCDRPECVADAERYVKEVTGRESVAVERRKS